MIYMKRTNKYPYTKNQWEEMKIDFNYSDKPLSYVYLENTFTDEWKDIDEVKNDSEI